MRKELIVIESQYLLDYNHPENGITIGGTQRYAIELTHLFIGLGYKVVLLTKSCKDYCFQYDTNVKVVALHVPYGTKGAVQFSKAVYDYSCIEKPTIVCYSDLEIGYPFCYINSFAIQHGIAWDNPYNRYRTHIIKMQTKKALSRFKRVICVDTNFINWAREFCVDYFQNPEKCVYIPNFADSTKFPYSYSKWDSPLYKLLYARRLTSFRGYDIFTAMCKLLLQDGYRIEPVYAFENTADEQIIRREFSEDCKYMIIHPQMDDMANLYHDSFLSFVPTRWSEGTSLSALESICCGCPVIVSDVGGLGNIVLPNFNGQIVPPSVKTFYAATKFVLDNPEIRDRWAKNCSMAAGVFGAERWKKQVLSVVQDVIESNQYD